jgi:putative phosphoesterase
MKIGVLSDTHDRREITQAAIRLLCGRGAELILHCGDIESPETVRLFTEVPTQFVFGNWDHSRTALMRAIRDIGAVSHDGLARIEVDNKRIGWLHGHVHGERAKLEHSGELDFLFYGHSHRAEAHVTGKTLVLNPGALHRARPKTVALVDVATGEWELVEVLATASGGGGGGGRGR